MTIKSLSSSVYKLARELSIFSYGVSSDNPFTEPSLDKDLSFDPFSPTRLKNVVDGSFFRWMEFSNVFLFLVSFFLTFATFLLSKGSLIPFSSSYWNNYDTVFGIFPFYNDLIGGSIAISDYGLLYCENRLLTLPLL